MIKEGERTCPECGRDLSYRDTTKRILREENGNKRWIRVDRYFCTNCHHVHREIPNFMFPYKQYRKSIIIGVRLGYITSDVLEYEDYPCEKTMTRWRSPIFQSAL